MIVELSKRSGQGTYPIQLSSDILLAYPGIELKQYLIYIGKEKLTMSAGLSQTGLNYCYQVLDTHSIACDTLLQQNTPEALVLAILCDFEGYSSREIVHRIPQGLQKLTGSNEAAFRDYFRHAKRFRARFGERHSTR